jgi:hypothetical protein
MISTGDHIAQLSRNFRTSMHPIELVPMIPVILVLPFISGQVIAQPSYCEIKTVTPALFQNN